MADDRDDFDGIDISGPWGGVRIGAGRGRFAGDDPDPEYRRIRRRVRRRLEFYRHAATFLFVVGGLALIDWLTGGGWWVQWVAGIWGAFLALQFFSTFITPSLWGREVEERMVRRELERRRGRVHVTPPGDEPPAG
ncbi:MAG TPA: 2TM domain-containing protein [Dehalococcoidia bacterium]|nr:2TM domain-containing protein [Dehalococcoidia bacterium]